MAITGVSSVTIIYKRDGIDLWSTITNFQIIRRATWPEADRSAEISEKNL